MKEILFEKPNFSKKEEKLLKPFFTNLDKSVYGILFLPPEVAGALCSRASRSQYDLRIVFLKEFLQPFLNRKSKDSYNESLLKFIKFFNKHSIYKIFSNQRAREFYIKWLAQYGDDSIAQMAGTYLIFSSLSQVAIKHIENQRIGIAPIEKSTRFVDFSKKIKNRFRYFIPPEIRKMNFYFLYKSTMDEVFEKYNFLYQKYFEYLKENYKNEKEIVIKSKAFDVVRSILPTSTLSQISLFGNGQAFEYLILRSRKHKLYEIRWLSKRAFEELKLIIPSFLRRIYKKKSIDYQKYLGERIIREREAINSVFGSLKFKKTNIKINERVKLIEYDKDGENKVIAALLYFQSQMPYEKILEKIRRLSYSKKEEILNKIIYDRKFRWYKVPRAFENVYLRFEIVTNIGAWRDIQRHRMHTQQHQIFTIYNGYEIPEELIELKLDKDFKITLEKIEKLYEKIYKKDPIVGQYCVSFAHNIRFMQFQNLRQFFWETELRTIPQGHKDYRKIEQEKAKIVKNIYPIIGKYLLVDFNDYFFARRGIEKGILKKEKELKKIKYG
jgi:thymidylate synthase ThyX